MTTSRARPTKTTRAPVIALLLRYCARRDSTRPSTWVTTLRSPRASGRASTFFAVHAVPRSSALPTAPGARSSRGTATSPTSVSTARPSRRTGMMRLKSGARRKATERTESSEKRNHWNQPGMWGPSHTARPTAIAERPKKKTKKARGVNASDASSASPSTSHSHHDIGRGVDSPTAAGPDATAAPPQEREVHDPAPRHVEPAAEARLGEAEARELAVRAVEDPRDLEEHDRRHHRRHAGHTEEEAPRDPERDADDRDGVRRDGRADEETGERPRQVAEEAVQVAVARVL